MRVLVCLALLVALMQLRISECELCEKLEEIICTPSNVQNPEGPPLHALCHCFRRHFDQLCCDFNNDLVVLNSEDIDSFEDVTLGNAEKLTYHPPCDRPQNITLINIGYVRLNNNRTITRLPCHMTLKVRNATVSRIRSYVSVDLQDTVAESVEESHLIDNLHVVNSTLDVIYDVTMKGKDENSECLTLKDSDLGLFDELTVLCDAFIDNVALSTVRSTKFFELRLSNSVIQKIQTDGLKFLRGYHRMKNVTFKHLEMNAITFEAETDVVLEDVKITKCDVPCIILNGGSFIAYGLEINGEPVDFIRDSTYIQQNNFEYRRIVHANNNTCVRKLGGLRCNLKSLSGMTIEFEPDMNVNRTTVLSHDNIAIRTHCYNELLLINCKGHVLEVGSYKRVSPYTCSTKLNQLRLESTQLEYIHSEFMKSLEAKDSVIGSIDVGTLHNLDLEFTDVFAVQNLVYLNATSSDRFNIHDLKIESIFNLVLRSSGIINEMTVTRRIENFVIDHQTNIATEIQDSSIERVSTGGINVKSGVLYLTDVDIANLEQGGIVVEKNGFLGIVGSESFQSIICVQSPGILAHKRSHVVWFYGLTPDWLRRCTKVMQEESEGNNTISLDDCTVTRYGAAVCDFHGDEKRHVLGGSNNLDNFTHVIVKNADELIISDHCFDKIEIHNTTFASVPSQFSCFYDLHLMHTSVDILEGYLLDLIMMETKVISTNLAYELRFCSFENCTFASIQLIAVNCEISNALIGDIDLVTKRRVKIKDSSIREIKTGAILVEENSRLVIENTRIDIVHAKGFSVKGHLTLKDVHIIEATNATFELGEYAYVELNNVSFGNHIERLFKVDYGPKFKLFNITMDGRLLNFSGELDMVADNLDNAVGGNMREDQDKSMDDFIDVSYVVPIGIVICIITLVLTCTCQAFGINFQWMVALFRRLFRNQHVLADMQMAPFPDNLIETLAARGSQESDNAPPLGSAGSAPSQNPINSPASLEAASD